MTGRIGDDANVNGLIAFTFACFGAGTPDADQFLKDLSDAGEAPPMAPSPFVAALPQRLLGHPNGSALAVIGHVDRAWGCSIKTPRVSEAQIGTFRNTIGNVLTGTPVGHAWWTVRRAFRGVVNGARERDLTFRSWGRAAERS